MSICDSTCPGGCPIFFFNGVEEYEIKRVRAGHQHIACIKVVIFAHPTHKACVLCVGVCLSAKGILES